MQKILKHTVLTLAFFAFLAPSSSATSLDQNGLLTSFADNIQSEYQQLLYSLRLFMGQTPLPPDVVAAIEKEDAGYCLREDGSVECFKLKAIEAENPLLCSVSQNMSIRLDCLSSLVQKTRNISYCGFQDGINQSTMDRCHIMSMLKSDDPLMCDSFNDSKRNRCLFHAAVNSNDSVLCAEIPISHYSDMCRVCVAQDQKDVRDCIPVEDPVTRDNCLKRKNWMICEQMKSA